MRRSSTPASTIARAITGLSRSRWARLAISGTTPPNVACSSICELTTLDRTSLPPITSAAAVSSQLVSMPSTSVSGPTLVIDVDVQPVDLLIGHRRRSSSRRRRTSAVWMSWHHITMASSVPS